jgi:7-keto-8-aminopelargonate synthetase-like enzyme
MSTSLLKLGPWMILVIVEGLYSMEGELCKLPEIIAIYQKNKV